MRSVVLLLLAVVAAITAYEAHGLDLGRALKWMDRRRALKVRQGRTPGLPLRGCVRHRGHHSMLDGIWF